MNRAIAACGIQNAEFKGLYGPDNKMILPVEKKTPVKRAHVVRYFEYPAEKQLLGHVNSLKGKRAERDLMIMEIGFGTGLRVAEMASLTVGHVRNREELTIVGKGSKERIIELSVRLQRAIKNFIKLKLTWQESIHDEAPLFVSQQDNRLSRRSLQEMIEKRCIKAGLVAGEGRSAYTFHCLRHTFAMRLKERGYKIEDVAELLGHSSLNSTRIYFKMSKEERREAVNSL